MLKNMLGHKRVPLHPLQRIYSIFVIEGTAPAIVLQRCYSPNLSLPALSDGQVVQYTADRGGRGWVSHMTGSDFTVQYVCSAFYKLQVILGTKNNTFGTKCRAESEFAFFLAKTTTMYFRPTRFMYI